MTRLTHSLDPFPLSVSLRTKHVVIRTRRKEAPLAFELRNIRNDRHPPPPKKNNGCQVFPCAWFPKSSHLVLWKAREKRLVDKQRIGF